MPIATLRNRLSYPFGPIPLLALVLIALLVLLFSSGCDLWVKGPEGQLFQVTLPDQELLDFLNRFTAGLAELRPLMERLRLASPSLEGLLQEVEASFRRLERAVSTRSSPAQPVDLSELRRALAALIQALESLTVATDQKRAALSQARQLQGLVNSLAAKLIPQPKLDPPPPAPDDDGDQGAASPPAPGCISWYEASDEGSSRRASPEEELAAFATRFAAIIGQMRLVLNAMNAPQLVRLLDWVEAAFQKMKEDIRSSSPSRPVDLAELRSRLAALNQAIAHYPCYGSRSRPFLEQGEELEALLEGFGLAAREGGKDGRCAGQDGAGNGPGTGGGILRAKIEIVGGDRTICLGDPQFSALGSIGQIVRYHWDFGDGQTALGPIVHHEYRKPGDYKVTLTVIDREGRTAWDSILVVVRYC
ncbi:MAG: PKD domain-containing protein [Candidatus Bipolaricaulia bacterium]